MSQWTDSGLVRMLSNDQYTNVERQDNEANDQPAKDAK